jgi:hypothetical protein
VIDLERALDGMPHFEAFLSLEAISALVARLAGDPRFDVRVAGTSVDGHPIHHVRFGSGSLKALLVAGPQAMEPIGGLTVYSLLSLYAQGNETISSLDVEWHVVPCIDPDAALLNESWYTQPFTLERYIRGFWMQPRGEQVDFSFPIHYKRAHFGRMSREAEVLKGVLDQVRPHFYFTLHNAGPLGGAWFYLSRDLGEERFDAIRSFVAEEGVNLQTRLAPGLTEYASSFRHMPTMKGYYDLLEEHGVAIPYELVSGKTGSSSHEYVEELRPDALTFVAELTYGRHPGDASDHETGQNLRQLVLRVDADNKYLATVILEEWDKTHDDLDATSPFYHKIHDELVATRSTLQEGVTEWYSRPIQELLFNPEYARAATEQDRLSAYSLGRAMFLAHAHTFARLLQVSPQTPAVVRATERLGEAFAEAFRDLDETLDLSLYEPYNCDTLARVQLGSGLLALDTILQAR